MEYIIAERDKANEWGFTELGHIVRGSLICLNEKEVMNNVAMSGTLEDRAEALCGYVTTASEAKMTMNNKQ